MRSILLQHAERYPLWEPADMYKLAHQAALGPEHAFVGEAAARDRLARELACLGPGPDEPLVDVISPDGQIVRVHLRPFSALDLSAADLLQAFIQTVAEIRSSSNRLEELTISAIQLAGEGSLPWSADQVKGCFERQRSGGYPAVRHSRPFEQAYRPAYRVVARRLLPEVFVADPHGVASNG